MKKTLVVLLFAFIGISVSAQDRTVTGKVTDAKDGAPLVAASVTVKGSTNGTATAKDGTFTLKVASNVTTLVISYLNYTTKEVVLDSRNTVNVALSQTSDLVSPYKFLKKSSFLILPGSSLNLG
jgi:iron complex outermembrane receptor protein